jgi:hypothetical protein
MRRHSGVRRTLKAVFSWDLVRKLKAQRSLLASGLIDCPEEWSKLRNEQTNHRYYAILDAFLQNPSMLRKRRRELDKYRMIHHIDDQTHTEALKWCGWTPDEFEKGYKEGDDPWSPKQFGQRGWRWYFEDLKVRLSREPPYE